MVWTIVITAAISVLAVVLAMNFATPEKKLERKLVHRYAVADPQFRREMGVMLGPSITHGNKVIALQNGDEIFPGDAGGDRAAPSGRSRSRPTSTGREGSANNSPRRYRNAHRPACK